MENKFFAAAIFMIFGIFMVTSHLNFAIAADSESGDSGGDDKKDSGDDKKDSGNDDKQSKTEEGSDSNDNQDTQLSSSNDDNDKPSGDAIIKSTPPTEEEEKSESDVQQQDLADINDKVKSKDGHPDDNGGIYPSKEEREKEKAAIEDYIYDDPGKVKLYPTEGVKEPWKKKLIESLNAEAEQKKKQQGQQYNPEDDPYEVCDVSEKCKGPGVKVDEKGAGSITNCIGYYCFGEEEKDVYEKIIKSGKCDGVKDSPKDKEDCLNNGGRGNGGEPEKNKCGGPWWIKPRQCLPDKHPQNKPPHGQVNCEGWNPDCKDKDKCNHWNDHCKKDEDWGHHHEGGHKHHDNNYCKHHDCHHHHHSSTHFSNHEGDVTVKMDLNYEEKDKDNLDDFFLFIGDVYDKEIDLSDKPDQIKVDHLDIDGGDEFAVCLANEDSQNGDCTVVEADNDHDTVEAFLTVR